MTQDMKKDTILHTEKGTYVHRLINICSSAHEHMFIGSRTYVHNQSKQIVRPGRTGSPLEADWESAWGGLRNSLTLLRSLLLLVILTLGTTTAWGQTEPDYSGTYYIGTNGYNASTPANNYYLCPTEGWIYYKPDDEWSNDGTSYPNPFLTTFKCKTNNYHSGDASTAVWIIQKHPDENYYYIKHASTGNYMVSNGQISGTSNANRMRVHLEEVAEGDLDDKELFSIETYSTYLVISPKSSAGWNGDYKWYTVNNGNKDYLVGNGSNGGPGKYTATGGIIGLYTQGDANAKFYLEVPAPTFSFSNGSVSISDEFTDVDIYYTTNGSNPTASSASSTLYDGNAFTPVIGSSQVKAIAISKVSGIKSAVATYNLPKLDAPTITVVIPNPSDVTTSGTATITTSVEGATIFYTQGNNPNNPTASSGTTTGDVTFTGPTIIKAVVGKAGYAMSDVTTKQIIKVAAPTFHDNGNLAIIIESDTPNAEIHYLSGDTEPSNPDASSPLYSGPLTGMKDKYIKAIAMKSENYYSDIASIGPVSFKCAKPVIKRIASDKFTIICPNPANATIHYTIGGGTPTASDTGIASGTEVSITESLPLTIKAIAMASGFDKSDMTTLVIRGDDLSGSGTADDPFQIATSSDFSLFINKASTDGGASALYLLTANISVSGTSSISKTFTGTFDGDGYTITGLTQPLFGLVSDAKIHDVNLKPGGTISSDLENVGAICNEASGNARIYNCGVLDGSVSGSGYVGGLVGKLDGSARVVNCFSYANIGGGTHRGGIVGYNNVTSTSGSLTTMVMNCMIYGDISTSAGSTQIAPIYCGTIIHNKHNSKTDTGLNNYNYFLYKNQDYLGSTLTYNGALGAEERYLNRFELFRMTLNSTRDLAAFYVTGQADDIDKIAKWVLDKSIADYPILKAPGYYPSIVNPDAEHAALIDLTDDEDRNKGRKFGSLTVKIRLGSGGAQFNNTGASLKEGKNSIPINITDKDFENYNFNYKKIQLPYYSEVGNGNYTNDRVVTGWKIVEINEESTGTGDYSTGNDVVFNNDGTIKSTPYNFVDRTSTNKDLYSVSSRVFNQGAYWEVPDRVSSITIEPYWAKAVYLSDANYDMTYSGGTKYGVTVAGSCPARINNQQVYNDVSTAMTNLGSNSSHTVYDYAIVLVGNFHQYATPAIVDGDTPVTIMSADLDGDLEPDNTLFYYHSSRQRVAPIRFDFLNMPGIGMVKRTHDSGTDPEPGIFKPRGWFEITNTVFVRFGQFEYAESSNNYPKEESAPLILQGGIYEQFVSGMQSNATNTSYILVGGNSWFKNFANGCHTQTFRQTPKIPISVAGGDYENFYLSGIYQPNGTPTADNAECYMDGGRYKEVAGAGMQKIDGSVTWLINAADITSFYGGGINDAQSITGNVKTVISNSTVGEFYGGPKFGRMSENKSVTTTATNCHFGTFYGAGYGGTSLNRVGCEDATIKANENPLWDDYLGHFTRSYETTHTTHSSNTTSVVTVNAISTSYDYEYLLHSDGSQTVARFFVNFASLSLATTRNVTSNLTDCTIGDFYGGGRLGEVNGDVTSTLTGCTVTGNVFGAGYSANIPTVEVWPTEVGLSPVPAYDRRANVFNNSSVKFPNEQDDYKDQVINYKWSNDENLSTSNPFYIDNKGTEDTSDDEYLIYTSQSLNNLGAVTGDVKLTIDGSTTVAKSVYGGGEESVVNRNTKVIVNSGTIGTAKEDLPSDVTTFGATYGNVYGGGKGKAQDEDGNDLKAIKAGLVKGDTEVLISGGFIMHNVYGGGAFGSVGDYDYDANNKIVKRNSGGTCKVTITGGNFGVDGNENGMVFGSSRGSEKSPITDPIVNNMAWVYDTEVEIGSTDSSPLIKGSVYGGGENGHNYHNAKVTILNGTIGVAEGLPITDNRGTPDDPSDDITYSGARYPFRGNVYGGGCGTDTYISTDGKYYNPYAGIVLGNATVEMTNGHVIHNVYGAGAMGSVGTFTYANDDIQKGKPTACPNAATATDPTTGTGLCTVTISGGQIGVAGMKMLNEDTGRPDDFGHVFGAGRGDVLDPELYPNIEVAGYVNNTVVTISGTAFVRGSVYGGSESGHVLGDTKVTIAGGQIGCGKNASGPYSSWPTGDDLKTFPDLSGFSECESWPYVEPYGAYDMYADDNGKYPTGSLPDYNDSAEGGYRQGSDGHTFFGNVFGGGSGYNPYAPGKWLPTAGWVEGNTEVNITGGHILTSVYGGNEMTDVGSGGVRKMTDLANETDDMFYDITKSGGKCTVRMSGGTLGVPRSLAQIAAHPVTCYLFGAGKGDQRIFFNKTTNVKEVNIEVSGGIIYGSIFGGGEDGHVMRDVKMKITKNADASKPDPHIGTWGTSYVDGNVFGGGRGFRGDALTAGNIGGSIEMDIEGGNILGSIYGGGRLGSVGYGLYLVDEEITIDGDKVKPYGILRPDNQDDRGNTVANFKRGYIKINISGGTIGNDIEYKYDPSADDKKNMPNTKYDYQNRLLYSKGGNVFAGCMGRLYELDGSTLLPLWPKLGKCKTTELNISGGHIKSSVYGGGELGVVAGNAKVNITGGRIGTKIQKEGDATKYYYYGSAFGGGKGSKDVITYPSSIPNADRVDISEAGTVEGNVEVNLNKDVKDRENKKGGIVNQVFGCNDMNGTPKGTVTVHVYATQNESTADINTKPAKESGSYDMEAVYGGGNLAAYKPNGDKNTTYSTCVVIDGCELTSIRQVYGGGNAASTPATEVTVNGTYEIFELFGGGNGADKLPENGGDNPGANVGFYDYSKDEGKEWCDTKEERDPDDPQFNSQFDQYIYGSGEATLNVFGGLIHRVFGGSNTKGNVRKTAMTLLEEKTEDGVTPCCPFKVEEAYGGGKSAPMDAEAILHMACIPGLEVAYGGAQEADIQSDVTLNITNGTFNRVFGGNNLSGRIRGSIKVNIEETGCRPVIIGELYGGGNLAGYSIYGYKKETVKEVNPDNPSEEIDVDKWMPIENPNDPEALTGNNIFKAPEVNIKSFTSIGEVYGGGLGNSATMVGSPRVNINVAMGDQTNHSVANIGENATTDDGLPIPSHEKGAIGAINNVYGGGNEAKVVGDTYVHIGTAEYVPIVTNIVVGETDVSGYYVRTGEGTTASPYTYAHPAEADKIAKKNVVYYAPVIGADIRGNVYGGGNAAEVTGETHVVIGKETTD